MDAMERWRRARTVVQAVGEVSRGAHQSPIDNSTTDTRIYPPSGPPSQHPLSPPGSPSQGTDYYDNSSAMLSQPYRYNTFGPAQSTPATTFGPNQYYSFQPLPVGYEIGPSSQHISPQSSQNIPAQHQSYASHSNYGQQVQVSPPLNAQPSQMSYSPQQMPQQLPASFPHHHPNNAARAQGYELPSPPQYPQRSHTLPGSFNPHCGHDSVHWDS